MNEATLRKLLESIRKGKLDVDSAVARLRRLPFEDMGFATVDHHRAIRCGFPEVIFCQGKTVEQVGAIFRALAAHGQNVLATRATREMHQAVLDEFPAAQYHPAARAIVLRQGRQAAPVGHIAVVAAGTSDLPVAEEARVTAEAFGQRVTEHYDVGVAGIHRLLAHNETLQKAHVVVAVAGMEGALASVVGGLVAVPVIAVPTSVGYGASFGGLSALLTMLNSCASNVSTVNIDNGFAGGYIASLINRQAAGKRKAH
ncbi:MAG TPA: nickel pincer cofactor biosynthesis protein LarB [Phycisphaerae bacterium]|nr:nickel pincer cofactor biosynthesis protein LarB [Phycisphaerae bacterium]